MSEAFRRLAGLAPAHPSLAEAIEHAKALAEKHKYPDLTPKQDGDQAQKILPLLKDLQAYRPLSSQDWKDLKYAAQYFSEYDPTFSTPMNIDAVSDDEKPVWLELGKLGADLRKIAKDGKPEIALVKRALAAAQNVVSITKVLDRKKRDAEDAAWKAKMAQYTPIKSPIKPWPLV